MTFTLLKGCASFDSALPEPQAGPTVSVGAATIAAVDNGGGILTYTTCPVAAVEPFGFAETVRRVAAWSEDAGAIGALVYTDNGLVDPWLVAQLAVEATSSFVPLVAVQPAYEHPFTTARTVASFQRLHGRAVHLNLVAGGFVRDLEAIGAFLDHDERYARLVEHATIVGGVLSGETVTLDGEHYQVSGLRMDVSDLDGDAVRFFVSGSSPAGLGAATTLGATPVRYPKPPGAEDDAALATMTTGIRLGIIARDTADEAWRLANERFPPDRAGEMKHSIAVKVSDSHWHRAQAGIAEGGSFWLHPVNTYKSFCPYLVGSHEDVAKTIGDYLVEGVRTLILDIPTCPEDVEHAMTAIELASTRIDSAGESTTGGAPGEQDHEHHE